MMNGIPYQQPQMWPMNPNQGMPGGYPNVDNSITERLNNLENQINRMERQLRRLDNRLNRVENSLVMPLNSQDTGYGNNNNKYMM